VSAILRLLPGNVHGESLKPSELIWRDSPHSAWHIKPGRTKFLSIRTYPTIRTYS